MSDDIEIIDDEPLNYKKKDPNDTFLKKNGEGKRKSHDIAKKLKQIFGISLSLNGFEFISLQEEIYCEQKIDNTLSFGENSCILYTVDFTIFYFRFHLKVLVFQYADTNEILKIDVSLSENDPKSVLMKELENCFKALRRRRNPTLLFKTLFNFTRAVESRRLIILIVLKKHSNNFKLYENPDGGIILNYANPELNLRVGLFWSITVDSMYKTKDAIHMYQNNLELQHKSEIKSILKSLGHPELHFIIKYHLWKHLITKLSPRHHKNLKRKQTNASFTNNISTSVIPSSSSESLWAPYQTRAINNSVQNLSVGAFKYLISSMPNQTPFGMFNRYRGCNPYLQPRFQYYNPLPQTLRRQQQYSTRPLTGSHQAGNSSQIFSSSRSFSGRLPVRESAPSSHTQTSSSTQPQNLLSHELEHSPRRACPHQSSKFYQKYNNFKNQKHSRSSLKSGSTQYSGSVIQTSHFKKRRGSDRSRIVKPDAEIIDMSNPRLSQKVCGFINTQESQMNCLGITKVNTPTEPKQDSNAAHSTQHTNLEPLAATNLGDTNIKNMSLNNNVELVNIDDANTNGLEDNFADKIPKAGTLENISKHNNLCIPITADHQCEVVRKSKKFNPFSLKFKDKLHKTSNIIKKNNNQASDVECVDFV